MPHTDQLIRSYYDAFNKNDMQTFLSLLADDVVHDVNQGGSERGKVAFQAFMKKMEAHYQEKVTDLVVMTEPTGKRASAEFRIEGKYLATDPGLPEAKGQTYSLPVGAFFTIRDGKITRVTNYYNLQDWIAQVK